MYEVPMFIMKSDFKSNNWKIMKGYETKEHQSIP